MSTLYWYNPYNDLALAVEGKGRFTPPKQAAAIARSGARLPLWWAEQGDCYVVDDQIVGVGGEANLDAITSVEPWGWSHDAKLKLQAMGVSERLLPDNQWLDQHRQLSHRRLTIDINSRLLDMVGCLMPPVPIELTDSRLLESAVREFGGQVMLKLPYSTSGRGVVDSTALSDSELRRRIEGMIGNQGSVMVERRLDKIADFAMLFRADGRGRVEFGGYSLFFAERGVAYSGNLLISDAEIRRRLSAVAGFDVFDELQEALSEVLSCLIGTAHSGWMGVDMMVYSDGRKRGIAPCVELNKRMTMGVVAHQARLKLGLEDPATLVVARHYAPAGDELALIGDNEFAFVVQKSR